MIMTQGDDSMIMTIQMIIYQGKEVTNILCNITFYLVSFDHFLMNMKIFMAEIKALIKYKRE